ncbi:MAG TPA: hypothetical protein DIU07_12125, partial [Rhodobacteraceae bacterium]|nr:hypothetical protein [Paracoccaceae bacterium]
SCHCTFRRARSSMRETRRRTARCKRTPGPRRCAGRTTGRQPASWALSDRARATGTEGMLYASRKRPDLTHLVLFRWNEPGGARLARTGEP